MTSSSRSAPHHAAANGRGYKSQHACLPAPPSSSPLSFLSTSASKWMRRRPCRRARRCPCTTRPWNTRWRRANSGTDSLRGSAGGNTETPRGNGYSGSVPCLCGTLSPSISILYCEVGPRRTGIDVPVRIQRFWGQYSPYYPAGEYAPAPTGCNITQVSALPNFNHWGTTGEIICSTRVFHVWSRRCYIRIRCRFSRWALTNDQGFRVATTLCLPFPAFRGFSASTYHCSTHELRHDILSPVHCYAFSSRIQH